MSFYFMRDHAPSDGDYGDVVDIASHEAAVDGFDEDTCVGGGQGMAMVLERLS